MVDINSRNAIIPSIHSKYLQLRSPKYKIHYFEQGEGEVILCLHGNPTWSFYFRHLPKYLSKNYKIIAYDHIGSGYSSRPKCFKYRLQDHIDILNEFIEAKKLKKFHLLVHDWGGAIGLGWAKDNIKKIDKLIITNSAAFYSKDIPKRIALLKLPIVGKFLMQKLNIFALASTVMASYKGLDKETKKLLLAPTKKINNRIGITKFVEDIPTGKSHPSYITLKTIEASLKNINVPTALMWGLQDFCFHREFLSTWKKIYPHAKVFAYKEAGHFLFEDVKHSICSDINKFLSKS